MNISALNKLQYSLPALLIFIIGGYFLLQNHQAPTSAETSVVELKDGGSYQLTASAVTKVIGGKEQKMLAYNGSIPGPEIHVPQGATVTINFKNGMDMPTLLHAHGVRMENAFDGSQLQQKEMKPGESFAYTLTFPDAGVFWYHPHANEVYGQALGLYGAFVVTPSAAGALPPVNREKVVFLSDLPIQDGTIAIAKAGDDYSLMGHYGNTLLVNGKEEYALSVKEGEVVRFAFVNAANARPFRLAMPGLKMKLVGGDNGAYEKASWQHELVLGPSERAIVDVLFPRPGSYELDNETPDRTYRLGTVTADAESTSSSYLAEFASLARNDAATASIEALRPYFAKAPDKKLTLTLDMAGAMSSMSGMGHGAHMMPDGTMMGGSMMMAASPDGIEWEDASGMMNSMSTTKSIQWHVVDADTGKKDMDIGWAFKKGEPVKIEIYNDPHSMHPMQHPIHFHGQRFLVVERDGVPQTDLVWKDTVLVKSGERVGIVLDPSNPGEWMAHCHIAEHLAAGMMTAFKVE